jgi:hypothetical protein
VNHRHDHRIEIETLVGEAVFVTGGAFLVSDLRKHEVVDELLQAIGQDRPADAEPPLEILEPADLQEAVAKDQQGPAIADHGERPRHRTGLLVQRVPLHPRKPSSPLIRGAHRRRGA